MDTSLHWQQRVGNQRDWVWRGWQTRYTYLRSAQPLENETPLILLHGFGASIGHWRHNLTALAQHHPVYALDLLGFGASEKAIANYDAMLWVEQVYDFWQAFIRKPVVLVGNSIGSLVSLAIAATYPEMVQGVVMISLPDPSVREEAIPALIRPLVIGIERMFTSPLLLRALFPIVRRPQVVRPWAAIAYANSQAVTDELVEILAGPAQDRGSAQAFCTILKAMTSSEFGPRVKTVLQTLDIPLLLLWGKQDRMIPKQLARPSQYLSYNSRLKLVELEDAGHCPHDECPERVNQEILEWMASWRDTLTLELNAALLPSLSLNE
ncbi:MAG: alpha/beta fold hydrolase [Scytolyngbya sp. HA4215-MV1]|nr:alpha/beta fold hydrolase [Scytolyngbya sp. HA4215-MV1]